MCNCPQMQASCTLGWREQRWLERFEGLPRLYQREGGRQKPPAFLIRRESSRRTTESSYLTTQNRTLTGSSFLVSASVVQPKVVLKVDIRTFAVRYCRIDACCSRLFSFIHLYKDIYKIMFAKITINVNAFKGPNIACDTSTYLLPILLQ